MKTYIKCSAIFLLGLILVGCEKTQVNVTPVEYGMILTPTGFQNKVHKPGQVDIGKKNNNGTANHLYVINNGGFNVKEAFTGISANSDGEDHRCSMQKAQPLTLDIRLFFAIPDAFGANGHKHLARLFSLTKAVPDPGGRERTYMIDPSKVYIDQARQEVRGGIRQFCAGLKDFSAAEKSFADEGEAGMTKVIERIVRKALKSHKIPLVLISARPSNMKPDQSVIDANAAVNAAASRVEAVKEILDGITESGNPKLAWQIFQLQVKQEIASVADKTGRGLIIMDTNVSGGITPLSILSSRSK